MAFSLGLYQWNRTCPSYSERVRIMHDPLRMKGYEYYLENGTVQTVNSGLESNPHSDASCQFKEHDCESLPAMVKRFSKEGLQQFTLSIFLVQLFVANRGEKIEVSIPVEVDFRLRGNGFYRMFAATVQIDNLELTHQLVPFGTYADGMTRKDIGTAWVNFIRDDLTLTFKTCESDHSLFRGWQRDALGKLHLESDAWNAMLVSFNGLCVFCAASKTAMLEQSGVDIGRKLWATNEMQFLTSRLSLSALRAFQGIHSPLDYRDSPSSLLDELQFEAEERKKAEEEKMLSLSAEASSRCTPILSSEMPKSGSTSWPKPKKSKK